MGEGLNSSDLYSAERVAHGMRMAVNRQEGIGAEQERENHGQPSRRRDRRVNPSPGPEPDSIVHGRGLLVLVGPWGSLCVHCGLKTGGRSPPLQDHRLPAPDICSSVAR